MLILDAPAEERHSKNSLDTIGISIIKYLDSTAASFCLAAFAHAAYRGCLHSLHMGVSLTVPCLFIMTDI
jgi:hypothetical protein